MRCIFLLTCVLQFCAVYCIDLKITTIENGQLVTEVQVFQFQGSEYNKRFRNDTVPAKILFLIEGVEQNTLELSWVHNNENLDVDRITENGVIPPRSNCYSTETYDKIAMHFYLNLTLTDKKISPGEYILTVKDTTDEARMVKGSGFINSAPILPSFPKPKRVLQGDPLRISCKVSSYPKVSAVQWSFAFIDPSRSDDAEELKEAKLRLKPLVVNGSRLVVSKSEEFDSVPNDTLRFYTLENSDNGIYACNASLQDEGDFTLLLVNVKDRWAALWPFIGIVIEVAVLVTAILLYERHQLRQKPLATGADSALSGANGKVANATPNNNVNSAALMKTTQGDMDTPVNVETDTQIQDDKLRQRKS